MTVRIALLGFGTVGKGTYRNLTINAREIEERTGIRIEVARILEKNSAAIESGIAPKEIFTQNFDDILNDKDIKIVAEILGGFEPATSFMLAAMKAGKSVVTPNKAVVAKEYNLLHKTAEENGVFLRYEASVCGAVPVINAITKSLASNRFTSVSGIVNGTTNYILTKMEEEGLSYEDALKQAQALGFAEADPTADVEGIDAANKLCILMTKAFGVYIAPDKIERKGISGVTKEDIEKAKADGKKIKLIAKASQDEAGNVTASVAPTLVDISSPLAGIRNELNGLLVSCNMAGDIFFTGKGAGMDPTGSAMAGDIIEIAQLVK